MSTEDQGENESERTNAAIGNALCDGGPLPWDHFKAFPDGNLDNISLEHYKDTLDAIAKQNAWYVCDEVVARMDDAPRPGCRDFLKGYVTTRPNEMFFWDKNHLMDYVHKPKTLKSTAPGHGYYSKLDKFIDAHFEVGELIVEFLKERCHETGVCDFCENGWTGLKLRQVPKPYPNYDSSFHYLHVAETPITNDDGTQRKIDDFQPRAQMKRLYAQGSLSNSDPDSITNFSSRYIIPEELVRKYVCHLEELNFQKAKRKASREEVTTKGKEKTY
jgi:hypothetical protein